MKKTFNDDMRIALGPETEGIIIKELDTSLGIADQFPSVTLNARAYIKQIESIYNTLKGTLTEVTNPTNSLLSTISYGNTLAGCIVRETARLAERHSILYSGLKPVHFIQSFISGMDAMRESLPLKSPYTIEQLAIDTMQECMRIGTAQRVALELAYIYKADEIKRQKQRRIEKIKVFDILGNYRGHEAINIMTINELEKTLSDVRDYIQKAIDKSRQVESLKDMALYLLIHVNSIKLEREKIMEVDVDNTLPLHLICLKYGLPYNYAERIYSINNIKNPSFTSGGVKVYAR